MIAAKHPILPSIRLCHHHPQLQTKPPVIPSLEPPAFSRTQGWHFVIYSNKIHCFFQLLLRVWASSCFNGRSSLWSGMICSLYWLVWSLYWLSLNIEVCIIHKKNHSFVFCQHIALYPCTRNTAQSASTGWVARLTPFNGLIAAPGKHLLFFSMLGIIMTFTSQPKMLNCCTAALLSQGLNTIW